MAEIDEIVAVWFDCLCLYRRKTIAGFQLAALKIANQRRNVAFRFAGNDGVEILLAVVGKVCGMSPARDSGDAASSKQRR